MDINTILALSPLDGRYQSITKPLQEVFSEYGLIKYRVIVELEWLKQLSKEPSVTEIPFFSPDTFQEIDTTINEFDYSHALAIKAIEAKTNHDVKAIEYWLKERLSDNPEIVSACEFIHFACTSEDINNLSHGLMLKRALTTVILPALNNLLLKLSSMAEDMSDTAMLSRTHGQLATPTTMGKELANVVFLLERQIQILSQQAIMGKLNGAVGNYNAHYLVYPNVPWEKLAAKTVTQLGLTFNPCTTQIEPHDYMAELFHTISRINTIILDLNRDIWGYISIGYFKQKMIKGEVGSSTMPHKVNPIDFENSEGNIGLANALFLHLAQKLPISRWQRDLSDSTVLRNMGVCFGYSLVAYHSCLRGLNKLELNAEKVENELDQSWALLAEPIQTMMRRFGIKNPYEQLKELTRGNALLTRETLITFIHQLNIPESEKQRLLNLTPSTYLGLASDLAKRYGSSS